MLKAKTKKYVFVASCAMLSLLLLILSGCDATSDPKIYYQATGSWEGTIGADRVRGIIAPDGSYQLAIVDDTGAFHAAGGEYVGQIGSVNPDNIGSMSLQRLQANESSGNPQSITFKLSADRFFSLQGIELTRTVDANGPAVLNDVVGHWSLSAADNLTAVVVDVLDETGILSGGDGQCQYSGSLELIDPAWNIYRLALTTADITSLSCPQRGVSYTGLAMKLGKEETRPRLWFAANSLAKTALGEWSKTINVAPVAQMAILGERADQSVLVQLDIGAEVELDAQHSTDANNDSLTYEWTVTYPGGSSLNRTGSTATFVPGNAGIYTLTLTVSDGIDFGDPLNRSVNVIRTEKRFIERGDTGTVLDTKTQLIWLKNAGCLALNLLGGADGQWGATTGSALSGVVALHADELGSESVCGLKDGSAAGEWDLPTLKEFRRIMADIPYALAPALINDAGTGLWVEGVDSFTNVAKSNSEIIPFYYYWAKEDTPTTWFYIDFSYTEPEKWYSSDILGSNSVNTVWPVRVLRPGESDMSGL